MLNYHGTQIGPIAWNATPGDITNAYYTAVGITSLDLNVSIPGFSGGYNSNLYMSFQFFGQYVNVYPDELTISDNTTGQTFTIETVYIAGFGGVPLTQWIEV